MDNEHSFICSFNKYWLSTHDVSGATLGPEVTSVKSFTFLGWWRERDNKPTNKYVCIYRVVASVMKASKVGWGQQGMECIFHTVGRESLIWLYLSRDLRQEPWHLWKRVLRRGNKHAKALKLAYAWSFKGIAKRSIQYGC